MQDTGTGQDISALEARIDALSRENEKLRRIRDSLMDRAEQRLSLDSQFSFLEAGVVLGDEIAQWTADLNHLNTSLLQQVAQREEAEAALRVAKLAAEEANLAKSRFVAAVGHDMLQPLTAARLFLGTLPQGETGSREARLIERLARCLQSAEAMLDSIQEYSRVEAKPITPTIRNFSVGELLLRLHGEYQMRCEDRGLEFRVVPSRLWVRTDAHILERILRNFLSNAVRYTQRGGVVAGCRRSGDLVRILVADQGLGIPQNRLRDIFEEFVQLPAPHETAEKGLGLGLAIVKRMADAIGAEIAVRSVPGRGSVFSVAVPRSLLAGSADRPAHKPLQQPSLQGKRILIVDNDEAVLEALACTVEGWGCSTLIAVSHATALEAVEQGAIVPDLVIADYHLENDRGTAVVGRLRALFDRPLPAIIVTADRVAGVPEELRRQGWTVQTKPLDAGRLRDVCQKLCFGS
ncbi:MAG: response regulator [Alphaproteobacteria bacterium]|nr:response regulator [Alphaproteobacteria bacterium]MDE2013838.1 response regulator [Alphaproteobacteria bacterium]MDE2074550.1 response regulator [Alphaproteobacteria bacterium]